MQRCAQIRKPVQWAAKAAIPALGLLRDAIGAGERNPDNLKEGLSNLKSQIENIGTPQARTLASTFNNYKIRFEQGASPTLLPYLDINLRIADTLIRNRAVELEPRNEINHEREPRNEIEHELQDIFQDSLQTLISDSASNLQTLSGFYEIISNLRLGPNKPPVTEDNVIWFLEHPQWLHFLSNIISPIEDNRPLDATQKNKRAFSILIYLLKLIDQSQTNGYRLYDDQQQFVLFQKCLNALLPDLDNSSKVKLFEALMEYLAKICVDFKNHPDDQYWLPIIEDLANGLSIIGSAVLPIYTEDNTCFNFRLQPGVASNDPFAFCLCLLDYYSSGTHPEGSTARLNPFLRTLRKVWENHFTNRMLVHIRTPEEFRDDPNEVFFVYTESTERIYSFDDFRPNITPMENHPWFKIVRDNLFDAPSITRYIDLNDPMNYVTYIYRKAVSKQIDAPLEGLMLAIDPKAEVSWTTRLSSLAIGLSSKNIAFLFQSQLRLSNEWTRVIEASLNGCWHIAGNILVRALKEQVSSETWRELLIKTPALGKILSKFPSFLSGKTAQYGQNFIIAELLLFVLQIALSQTKKGLPEYPTLKKMAAEVNRLIVLSQKLGIA